MPKVQTYESVVARVRGLHKSASAPTEKDPADQGTRTAPADESAASMHLPTNRKEHTSDTPTPGFLNQLKPGPTGTDVPSTTDGKPKEDAATSPTVELSKIATDASSIAGRINALQKQASAPAAGTQTLVVESTEDENMLTKLAHALLSTEEGVSMVEGYLVKAAGAEGARNLMAVAQAQHEAAIAQVVQADQMQKAAAAQEYAEVQAVEEILKSASVEERDQIFKIASVHKDILATIDDPMEKAAYQQGASDAASMMDSAPDAQGGPQLPGAQEGGPQDLQEIAQLLMVAVQNGELDQETAEKVMQELASAEGGQGGGAAAGAPPAGGAPEAAAAGGAPAGEASEPDGDELPKAAAALARELTGI